MKKVIVLIILLSGFAVSSFAQVTATANSSATIITPIALSSSVPLAFGALAVNGIDGTVVLTAASSTSRSRTGGVTLPISVIPFSSAKFTTTGLASSAYTVSLPTTASFSTGTMTITPFTIDATGYSRTLNSSGSDDFYVGATLNVPGSSTAGSYSGTFDVTVNYN